MGDSVSSVPYFGRSLGMASAAAAMAASVPRGQRVSIGAGREGGRSSLAKESLSRVIGDRGFFELDQLVEDIGKRPIVPINTFS